MTQVRRRIIAALALFTVAITLDRMGVSSGDRAIAGHAYVIALVAVLLPLISNGMRRKSAWTVPIAAGGVLIGYSVLFKVGFSQSESVHLAVTEFAFVTLAAWLGHEIGWSLDRIDDLLMTAAFGESPALDLEGPTAANEIHTEIARGRRHDRPLSVTVLSPTAEGLEKALDNVALDVDRSIRTRFLFGSLTRAVADQLRRSDLLFEHRPGGQLIVLSPETDAEGTALLVRRILDAAARVGIETRAGTAAFPEDGIGFESLVDHAQIDLEADADPHLRAVERGGIA